MSARFKILNVLRKPRKCPNCGQEEGQIERVNQMSEAFKRLSEVTASLTDGAEELKDLAPDVDLLKDYITSGQWLKDFEADERGEIGPDVDCSVLSEDGLYNLMEAPRFLRILRKQPS